MDTAWIDAGGVALRYELSGPEDRPVVVLVHEMGGTLESWDGVVPVLRREYRVLRFDMRGFGMSEKISGEITGEQLAADLRALLDALGLRAPVALVGCAVGAAIALRFAAAYPEQTAAVIVSSPATGIPEERRASTLERIACFEGEGLRVIEEASLATSYPPVLREADPDRFEMTRQRWLGNDPRSFAAVFRMLVASEMAEDLARISAPTLVLGCNHDLVRPPAMAAAVAASIPGARFATIESGHLLPIQNPELLSAKLLPFLAERRHRFRAA